MAVTCFVPSVVRSGIMCLLYLLGILFSRRPDSLNSLSAAVLLIGLFNPYAAADVGLLLSFFATLGLILLSNPVSGFLNKKIDRIKTISPLVRGINGVIATTAGAVLFTLPIVIITFGNVSLAAPISNLLELVPSTLMMNFAAIAAVLNLIAPKSFLAMPFALVSGLLAKYMQACAHWLAQIPYASISVSYGFVLIWLAGTILLIAATILMMKSRRLFKVTALLSSILLLIGIFSYQIVMHDVTRLAILDVGSSESVVLTRNGHAAVIGCGGFSSNSISTYLRGQGITQLDYIQPLTLTKEESENTAELINQFAPKRLVMQSDDCIDGFLEKAVPNAASVSTYVEAAASSLWNNADIRVQSIGAVSAVRITVHKLTILICPSGADFSVLPKDWLYSDFVVADSLPENASLFEPVYLVLSMDEEDLRKNASKMQDLSPIVTGWYGSIVLELKNDNTLKLRRE